jgi:hypothetical protein
MSRQLPPGAEARVRARIREQTAAEPDPEPETVAPLAALLQEIKLDRARDAARPGDDREAKAG